MEHKIRGRPEWEYSGLKKAEGAGKGRVVPPATSVKMHERGCNDGVISLGFHKQRDTFAEK